MQDNALVRPAGMDKGYGARYLIMGAQEEPAETAVHITDLVENQAEMVRREAAGRLA